MQLFTVTRTNKRQSTKQRFSVLTPRLQFFQIEETTQFFSKMSTGKHQNKITCNAKFLSKLGIHKISFRNWKTSISTLIMKSKAAQFDFEFFDI